MTCKCTDEGCNLTRIESLVESQAGSCTPPDDDEQINRSVN